MRINEYQQEALRTASGASDYPRILNGVLGLTRETGECVNIIKKHLFQGHELDRAHQSINRKKGDI